MDKNCWKNMIILIFVSVLFISCTSSSVQSQEAKPQVENERNTAVGEIESRHVDIWSDGTRLSGDLWYPKGFKAGDNMPAILIIVAEHEQLMNNKDHGEKVYHIVKNKVAAKYEVFPGTHFEIYGRGRMQAINTAIDWYKKHL